MDKLKRYLQRNAITAEQFAGQIGVSPSAISQMLGGKILPSLATARKIEAATNGRVRMQDWVRA